MGSAENCFIVIWKGGGEPLILKMSFREAEYEEDGLWVTYAEKKTALARTHS